MKQNFIILMIFVAIPLQLYHLYSTSKTKSSGSVAGIKILPHETRMSLSLGTHRFLLFGYTSPQAIVSIDSIGVSEQTMADNKGYFEFNDRFSPFSPREVCLISRDQLGRSSTPLCLPPFATSYDVIIGPVVMPPTVSLNKPSDGPEYFTDDEIKLSGQTIPDADVRLSLFTGDAGPIKKASLITTLIEKFTFIKPVEGFSLPQLDMRSDSLGNYSVALPSSKPDSMRVFARAKFNNFDSPKSNSLSLNILPIWMVLIVIFNSLINLIRPRLFEIITVIELAVVAYLMLKRFMPIFKFNNQKSIVLYHHPLPIPEQSSPLVLIEHKRPV